MKIKNLFVVLLSCSAICAVAQVKSTSTQVTRDLSPLLKAGNWNLERKYVKAADTTVTIDGEKIPALNLSFVINHIQPDGSSSAPWPYAQFRSIPADVRDWNEYDSVEISVCGTINRIDEINLPLLVAFVPEKGTRTDTTNNINGVGLFRMARGKWVTLSIPIAKINEFAKITEPVKIKEIKFALDGAQYRQGDELEIQIAKFQLVRETVSRVKTLKMLAPAIYANAPIMPVELFAVGNEKELKAGLPVEILDSSNKKVWGTTLSVEKGMKRYDLDIAAVKLQAGAYRLIFSPQSDQIRKEASFTVVTSPWQ